MHIHILGVCGTFMGGLALIARERGHRVTGCDQNVYPPMSTQLAEQGVEVMQGYGEDQLRLNPDLWVIGNVVTRGVPLMEAILERGDRYVSGPQWLAENVLFDKWVLAVAGTHGKTTTASMLAWILEATGNRPGFLIGGVPENFGVSARLTDSPYFVIEADEYDTAFFDKRSKFVHYPAKTALLNNLEFDHADIFGDLAAIETQFHHFVRIIRRSGRILVPAADEALQRVLARGAWADVQRLGAGTDWDLNLVAEGFDILYRGEMRGRVQWTVLGEFNARNALGAIAAAEHAGVPPEEAAAALGRFKSVRRRLELRGEAGGVYVYDDFAHHPTAIAETLRGLRASLPKTGARVLAVLEPRSNTMKLGIMKDRLADCLVDADRTYCYANGLGWDAAAALAPLGERAVCEPDFERLITRIVGDVQAGDRILVMSNGGFGGIHDKLLARLRARPAAC